MEGVIEGRSEEGMAKEDGRERRGGEKGGRKGRRERRMSCGYPIDDD
jgi:hypothetical protein